jgi:hypothetical protein
MTDSGPPSSAAVAVAVGLIALTAGYLLGQGSAFGFFGKSKSSQAPGKAKSWPNSYDVTIHPDSSDEELMAQQRAGAGEQAESSESDEEGDRKELKTFPNNGEEVKLVVAVRTDLGMGKGTSFAVGHGTRHPASPSLIRWHFPQAKLQHNAPMQPWPVTNIFSIIPPPSPFCDAGKEEGNPK